MATVYGGVEAGGTKFVVGIGTGPDDVRERARFPTTTPGETLGRVAGFLREAGERHGPPAAVGVASFGPLELRRSHPDWGRITSTPKPGWSGIDVAGTLAAPLGVPIGLDTDVNAAALAEWRWGAAQGAGTAVYVTVGTGIGGGGVVGGKPLHGLGHPEMGHVAVPRREGDDYPGCCPFHGDCWEGMASGRALAGRWGRPAEALGEVEAAVETEAWYLAAGLRQVVYALAPDRVVVGGGVAALPGLRERTRSSLVDALAGYSVQPEHRGEGFLVAPGLGADSGLAGAFALAEAALAG